MAAIALGSCPVRRRFSGEGVLDREGHVWSWGSRCLIQKFRRHCPHTTGITSFFLHVSTEHWFVYAALDVDFPGFAQSDAM